MTGCDGWDNFDDPEPPVDGGFDDVDVCRALWENTRNISFVLQAIHICIFRSISEDLPAGSDYPMPDWCMKGLLIPIWQLLMLSEGKDFRSESNPAGAARLSPDAYRAWADPLPSLSPQAAVELVPLALGITGQGANAFKNKKSLDTKIKDFLALRELTDERKLTRKQALEVMADERGVADLRTIERRIADAMRAYRFPSGPASEA